MSKQGITVAQQFGSDLPAFSSLAEAEKALFALRDTTLTAFTSEYGQQLNACYTAESLKSIEKWYFKNNCPKNEKNDYSLSLVFGFYFGEVLCRNSNFDWFVAEFVFKSGWYEIGVRRPRMAIMLTKGKLPRIQGNKRMESLGENVKNISRNPAMARPLKISVTCDSLVGLGERDRLGRTAVRLAQPILNQAIGGTPMAAGQRPARPETKRQFSRSR